MDILGLRCLLGYNQVSDVKLILECFVWGSKGLVDRWDRQGGGSSEEKKKHLKNYGGAGARSLRVISM